MSNVTYAPFLAWAQEIFMAALATMGLAPGAPMRWLTGSPCCRT